MAPEYLRGHMLTPPLEYSTQDRLLAEIQASLVELVHEAKTTNDLLAQLADIERRQTLRVDGLAPRIEQIAVQVTAMAVQLGRLVERGGA